MPDVDTYPAGVPCWVETLQPDLAAAMRFYAGVFGWAMLADDEDTDVRRRDPARAGGSRYRQCGGGGLGRRRRLVHPGPRRRPRRSTVTGGRGRGD